MADPGTIERTDYRCRLCGGHVARYVTTGRYTHCTDGDVLLSARGDHDPNEMGVTNDPDEIAELDRRWEAHLARRNAVESGDVPLWRADAERLIANVIARGDSYGDLANSPADLLRDALRLACERLRDQEGPTDG